MEHKVTNIGVPTTYSKNGVTVLVLFSYFALCNHSDDAFKNVFNSTV